MATLGKLMPLIALAGVGATQKDKIEEVGGQAVDMVKVIATKHELTTIRTAIMNENAAGNMQEVRSDFHAFVKRIAHSDQKDVTMDFWDNPYLMDEDDGLVYLTSLGPDCEKGTDDDITISLPIR